MSTVSYSFSAMNVDDGTFTPLRICEADDSSDAYLLKVWHKMYQSVIGHFKQCQKECPEWATWMPHEWTKKKVVDRHKFVVWDGDVLVGFLNFRYPIESAFAHSQQILYIEHVGTSPGNMNVPIWNRRLKHIGIALLAFSVLKSIELGSSGIVGLHSTVESEPFYNALNSQRGGTLFNQPKSGVQGFYDGNEGQQYFEMTQSGADELLEDYCNA